MIFRGFELFALAVQQCSSAVRKHLYINTQKLQNLGWKQEKKHGTTINLSMTLNFGTI